MPAVSTAAKSVLDHPCWQWRTECRAGKDASVVDSLPATALNAESQGESGCRVCARVGRDQFCLSCLRFPEAVPASSIFHSFPPGGESSISESQCRRRAELRTRRLRVGNCCRLKCRRRSNRTAGTSRCLVSGNGWGWRREDFFGRLMVWTRVPLSSGRP